MAGLIGLVFSFPARADRLPKPRETRPSVLNGSRSKVLASDSGLVASLTFPRGEPKRERTFDVIVCLKFEGAKGTLGTKESAAAEKGVLAGLTLAAVMPEHAHGMMVTPLRVPAKSGQESCQAWRGLRFHMAGWWRLELRPTRVTGEVPAKATAFDFDVAPTP